MKTLAIFVCVVLVINQNEARIVWVAAKDGGVPRNSIIAGYANNEVLFACRAWHRNELALGE